VAQTSAIAVEAADTSTVLRYQRPKGLLLNRPVNCSMDHGVGHRSSTRMMIWPSDLKAVTTIQYSGASTKKSSRASATQDPSRDTTADVRRRPEARSAETTHPTAAAIPRITPRTTAAFQKMCGDAQASRPVTAAATAHGRALRTVPGGSDDPVAPSRRSRRTRTNTSPPMIGSITRVTAAPAPNCSCRIAFE
jgi:hypothetical protein